MSFSERLNVVDRLLRDRSMAARTSDCSVVQRKSVDSARFLRVGVLSHREDTKQEDEETDNGSRQQPGRVEPYTRHIAPPSESLTSVSRCIYLLTYLHSTGLCLCHIHTAEIICYAKCMAQNCTD